MQPITSLSNPKIKQIIKLAEVRSYRYELGLAVIYGEHLIEEALKYQLLHSVFIRQAKVKHYSHKLSDFNQDNMYSLSDDIITKIDISDSAVDIIGVINMKFGTINDDITDCIILDNIQDPGNLGTIMRSCTACGIEDIILSRSCVDPYNLKVLRASQGIQFKLNIITVADVTEFIANYKYEVIAAMPNALNSIYVHNLTRPCAWVFGNEGSGISTALLEATTDQLAIPMKDSSESLNVAMAATVCLFEMSRQRINCNSRHNQEVCY